MTKVDIITDSPLQTMTVKLENGQALNLTLRYSYNQQGWFYSFTYGSYTINNRRIVYALNMLRSIRNVVPFGLACFLTDLNEPVFVDDFKNGRASLYTLNATDVEEAESVL